MKRKQKINNFKNIIYVFHSITVLNLSTYTHTYINYVFKILNDFFFCFRYFNFRL